MAACFLALPSGAWRLQSGGKLEMLSASLCFTDDLMACFNGFLWSNDIELFDSDAMGRGVATQCLNGHHARD